MKKLGLSVKGITFTTTTNQQLVEDLMLHIEQETVSFPEIPELVNELSIFQNEITRSGTVKYSAPSGYHDDCVAASARTCGGETKDGGDIRRLSIDLVTM